MSVNVNVLYKRQEALNIKCPQRAIIVGVGGAGSWAALFLGMAGVPHIALVDPDVVEPHNLNRLPLPASSVGMGKALSLALLLREARPGIDVLPVPTTVEAAVERGLLRGWEDAAVVDARDRGDALPPPLKADVEIRYDGHHYTITWQPWASFDAQPEQQGYIVPSWVGTAAFVGLTAAVLLCVPEARPASPGVASGLLPELVRALFITGGESP